MTGSYTQAADATLNEQLGGTPTSSQFGVLAVAGQASLAGTLAIATVNGFGPLTGQVFDVAGYSLTSGTFSSIQGQTINGIPTFTTAVNSGGIVVTAVANAADLTPTSVSLPASVLVGQPLTVHYTVSNLQPAATLASAWTDSVYLSADGTIDSSSILLGTVAHSGAVSGNGDYSASLTATVPPAPPATIKPWSWWIAATRCPTPTGPTMRSRPRARHRSIIRPFRREIRRPRRSRRGRICITASTCPPART